MGAHRSWHLTIGIFAGPRRGSDRLLRKSQRRILLQRKLPVSGWSDRAVASSVVGEEDDRNNASGLLHGNPTTPKLPLGLELG
jgi:hypothetical protein